MNTPDTPLKIFLCHASIDTQKARKLYHYLKKRGIQPWLDQEDLLPGQDWEIEIPNALETSDVVLICLTQNSVEKEGYIHKEIKFAVEKALEMPEGRISLIPVKFEKCEIPFALRRYQWVDLTSKNGYSRLMKALKKRALELKRKPVELASTTSAGAESTGKTSSAEVEVGDDVISTGNTNSHAPRHKDSTPEKKGSQAKSQKPPKKDFPWNGILGFLGAVLAAYIGFLGIRQQVMIPIEATRTAEAKLSATVVQVTPPPTDTPQPTFTSLPTLTPTQLVCPYQGQTEHETIVNLIQAEAEAVLAENPDIINAIFAPNAGFYDYAAVPPDHWNGIYARYTSNLFPKLEFKELEHFDILPAEPGINGNTAYYTSGSKGSYRRGAGPWLELDNGSAKSTRYGSEHWILEKNGNGCWIIVEMQFNAGDEKFP